MERRGLARRRARGGDGIQTVRPTRPRVAAGGGALALAAGLAAYPPLLAGGAHGDLLAIPGAIAIFLVLAALASGRESLVLFAVALLGGAYAAGLVVRGSAIDGRAPLVTALLCLVPELAGWSVQATVRIDAEPAVARLRATVLGLVALASGAAAALVIGVTVVETPGGLAWEAVGVGAAVGALAVVHLARS